MTDEPTTLRASPNRLKEAQRLWILREDVSLLQEWAYHFSIEQYDGDWCEVEIHGHADDPEDND